MFSRIIIDALENGKSVKVQAIDKGVSYSLQNLVAETKDLLTFETSNSTVYLKIDSIAAIEVSGKGGRVGRLI
ncbi:hypothetical protein [Macrococcus brunensis]|uniref:hypothetical protein n=1 Tax=Macrococcus brunensis TaxID=198483 RepID=UPI001EEFE491|nr:hypothetical protein [Macrococcus brunensis]ULG72978.1 hypothetical protein MGG12_05535 [Macrococcus brunensis]